MRKAIAALALVTVLGRRPINHPRGALLSRSETRPARRESSDSRVARAALSIRAERRKFVIHLTQVVTAFGGHSTAPLIITEIADAPDPAERYVELFTAGPFTPKWLSRSKSEIFTKTEKTSETVAITISEDDLSPNSQFLLVCADRDAFVAKYDLACNIEAPDFFEDFDGDVRVAIQEMVDSTLGPIVDKYGGFAINETLQHYYHAAAEAVASAASTTGKTSSEETNIQAGTAVSNSGSAEETYAEADSFVVSTSSGNPEEDNLLGFVTNTIDVKAATGDEQALSSLGFMNGGLIVDGHGVGAISTNVVEAAADAGSVGAEVSSEMLAGVKGYFISDPGQCLGQTACLADGSPCATGEFCNWADDSFGTCEQCSSFSGPTACYNDGLPRDGGADCVACCFPGAEPVGGPVYAALTSKSEDYVAAGTDTSLGSYTSSDVSGGAEPQGPLDTSGVVVSKGGSAAKDAEGSFDGNMKGELGLGADGATNAIENYVAGSAEAGQASAASDSLLVGNLYAQGDLASADFNVGAGIANSCVE